VPHQRQLYTHSSIASAQRKNICMKPYRHHRWHLSGLLGLFCLLGINMLSNAAPQSWRALADMPLPLSNHTATLLPNDRIIVVGGRTYDSISAEAFAYDLNQNRWAAIPSLPQPRRWHTATLLPNGKLLVVGGFGGQAQSFSGYQLASTALYDVQSNSWTASAPLAFARSGHTATLLANGKVLITGGVATENSGDAATTRTELYDPTSGEWTAGARLATPRIGHTTTLLPSGKVLVAGGQGDGFRINSTELFDPSTNTWQPVGNMAISRSGHAATLLANGNVLVSGGFTSSDFMSSAEIYDVNANSWRTASPMAVSRIGHAMTTLSNGKVLAYGGYLGTAAQYNDSAEIYDPIMNKWIPVGTMTAPRDQFATVLLPNDRVVALGGAGGGYWPTVDLYDYTLSPEQRPSSRGLIDIDGDSKSEILLKNATGQLQLATYSNGVLSFRQTSSPGSANRLIAVGDIDGDGKSDLIFQNTTQGEFGDVRLWKGFEPANEIYLRQVKQVWDAQATGDLDGDGYGDLVWRYVLSGSPDTGVSYVWFTDGRSVKQVRKRGGAPLDWTLLGAADINADGAADMFYLSPANQLRVLMATPNRTCANFLVANLGQYKVLRLADFSGRLSGDILLQDVSPGRIDLLSVDAVGTPLPAYQGIPDDPNAACTATSTRIPSVLSRLPNIDSGVQFWASGDVNGDGRTDIIWRRPDGTLTLWLMKQIGMMPEIVERVGSVPIGFTPFQP
jgi:Galactose oxidase, central domain/Kelch motif/FG-GAP-like repeat/FG-GAP repeat